MLTVLVAALLLGAVAGLRTFTPPAVLWAVRHGGIWAYVLSFAALVEYAGDVLPKTPPRTQATALLARLLSGGFCGWQIAAANGAPIVAGVALGCAGAFGGAYGGLWLRRRASGAIGNVPAGLIESLIAVIAAFLIVTYA